MNVTLPPLAAPLAGLWPVLFELATARRGGWILAGSQMVIVHAAAHGVRRPLVTQDADLIVDVHELPTADVAGWLRDHDFQLDDVSPEGIGHRFRRGQLVIDVLAIDHTGRANLTTVPPARTIEVPGGRRAIGRVATATVTTADQHTGTVPIPDWLGAVLLKARASVGVPGHQPKHRQDLVLLLSLPVDVTYWAEQLAGKDRKHLRRAGARLDDSAWRAVSRVVDVRRGQAALKLLT